MGVLDGVKVVEFAGIGPGPMACMLLADMGANVLRIDRAANVGADIMEPKFNTLLRGRKNIALDLKHPDGVEAALKLCDQADILIEGFRPGVMERLGLGPDVVFGRNARMVYGRMTGWGQDGPIASTAGHDINYIARSVEPSTALELKRVAPFRRLIWSAILVVELSTWRWVL